MSNIVCGCPKCKVKSYGSKHNIYTKALKYDYLPEEFPCFLYVLEFHKDEERFIKVGITSNFINHRFKLCPYEYKVLYLYQMSLSEACIQERDLLKSNKDFKYSPKIFFKGHTECMSLEALSNIETVLLARNGQADSSLIDWEPLRARLTTTQSEKINVMVRKDSGLGNQQPSV